MNITIRKAVKNDYPVIIELIKELAFFEKAPEKVINTVERMNEEEQYFEALVAEKEDGEIAGMALYFFAYYTWVGKSLYLDDLIVKEKYRGNKIGTQLLEEIMNIAKKSKCKRVRWQVLDWNTPAIEFYRSYGADLDGEWINCDMENF
ncbi:MAG TPA: GNAT family N-acetyltransferase [Bacteroidetes bacterium]|nr:GNAT family N-acetyltransferase [Bacteroidota bacterium]